MGNSQFALFNCHNYILAFLSSSDQHSVCQRRHYTIGLVKRAAPNPCSHDNLVGGCDRDSSLDLIGTAVRRPALEGQVIIYL